MQRSFPVILILVGVLLFFSCGGEKAKPHILLITIDTLRRDHLGSYGYYRETSPFIDSLAREGVLFKHAITPIPSTAGSHASILTSLHPLTHNVTLNGTKLNDEVQTLAEILKKNGYYTIGTVAVGLLGKGKNFSQGFDSFSGSWKKEEGLNPKFPLAERTASSVNKDLFKQIDEYCVRHKEKPLFIWVHYYDPHTPYYQHPDISLKTAVKEGLPRGINLYDAEIRYTDEHIEKLYKYLEKKEIASQLVTCITADHGEQFAEHGFTYGHMDFYSENTYVPLIFHGNRIPKNKVIDTYASTMDIGVTLLKMAGPGFGYPTEGIDLSQLFKQSSSIKDRKFLIIGNPKYARSLQLLGYPYAYILNFDYHYKYWYVSTHTSNQIAEIKFKPLPPQQIEQKGNIMYITLPYTLEKGLNYAVLRAEISPAAEFAVEVKVKPLIRTNKVKIPKTPGKITPLEVIYPVTVLDDIGVLLYLKGNTRVDKVRYAFISREEFPGDAQFTEKIENGVFKRLKTLRKKKEINEFFNLSTDIEMKKNQVKAGKCKPIIMDFTKFIYEAVKYYNQKKAKLFRGLLEHKELSKEDKKMLETLGYL